MKWRRRWGEEETVKQQSRSFKSRHCFQPLYSRSPACRCQNVLGTGRVSQWEIRVWRLREAFQAPGARVGLGLKMADGRPFCFLSFAHREASSAFTSSPCRVAGAAK